MCVVFFLAAPSLSMFSILVIPSIRSIMSSLVGEHEQGAYFNTRLLNKVIL